MLNTGKVPSAWWRRLSSSLEDGRERGSKSEDEGWLLPLMTLQGRIPVASGVTLLYATKFTSLNLSALIWEVGLKCREGF